MNLTPLRLLILGGTGDAAKLAGRLAAAPGVVAISSLAGRVAHPVLPDGDVRVGGFGGVDGLVAYLRAARIDGVIDVTHPFAAQISRNAALACEHLRLPLLAVLRPCWSRVGGDRWHDADDVKSAAALAPRFGGRIFVTVGRQALAPFAAYGAPWYLIRAIDLPNAPLPARHELLLERGPFDLDAELALMRSRAVDVVVSKNSGGPATYAKIAAARALGIPVVMVKRPPRPLVPTVETIAAAASWVDELRGGTRTSRARAGSHP